MDEYIERLHYIAKHFEEFQEPERILERTSEYLRKREKIPRPRTYEGKGSIKLHYKLGRLAADPMPWSNLKPSHIRDAEERLKDSRATSEDRSMLRGYANHLMREGLEGNVFAAAGSAKIYDALGEGSRPSVKRKLLKSVEAYEGLFRQAPPRKELEEIESFLKKNPTTKRQSLEITAGATTGIACLLGAILFSFYTLTGNIISISTNQTFSYIGGILFIIGLIGALVYFKRR